VSVLAEDEAGTRAQYWLEQQGINSEYLLKRLKATPQSIIQYDPSGKRQIYVDLKDIQDITYPEAELTRAANDCEWLIFGTLNICRPYLSWAKNNNKKVACDLHVFNNLDDQYHQDFLLNSKVIFMSNEYVLGQEQDFAQQLIKRFLNVQILVIGMGAQGALLFERSTELFTQVAAQTLRPIVNTVGAGDALFSAFMHFYTKDSNASQALNKAVVFASWKIGVNGASFGFLCEEQLEKHFAAIKKS